MPCTVAFVRLQYLHCIQPKPPAHHNHVIAITARRPFEKQWKTTDITFFRFFLGNLPRGFATKIRLFLCGRSLITAYRAPLAQGGGVRTNERTTYDGLLLLLQYCALGRWENLGPIFHPPGEAGTVVFDVKIKVARTA